MKTIKVAKRDTRKTNNGLEIKSLLLVSGSKAAVIFELEEQICHQMTFFNMCALKLFWEV